MRFYRCLICGEVYLGTNASSHCPHCGVRSIYLVLANEWTDENQTLGELSEVSRLNLLTALQLEVNNAPFYRDAMKKTGNVELEGIFKYLAKIEMEHASAVLKILKCELPPPEAGREVAAADDRENLTIAHEREVSASAFYARSANEAVELRIRKLFIALSQVEADHIQIERDLLQRI